MTKRRINYLYVVFACLLFFSCPLMTVAPHYHELKPIGNSSIEKVEVFCTPKSKTYHLFYEANAKIKGRSAIFSEDSFIDFEHKLFFEKMKYTYNIKINDRHFYRSFINDTLEIRVNNSTEILKFKFVK